MDGEDLIAVHARALKEQLQRDGYNPDPLLDRLNELVDTYGKKDTPELLSLRIYNLEKAFNEHLKLFHVEQKSVLH